MPAFVVKLADLTIEANFERVAFSLLGATWNRAMESIYGRLERYGVTPKEITLGQVGSVGDRHMTFLLPKINGGVKVYVSKIEIGLNNVLIATFEDLRTIVAGVTESLREAEPNVRFGNAIATYNVHGTLEGIGAAQFLASFLTNRPKGLGPDTGGAAGFYYGTEGPRIHLSVIMDGSVMVPDGLYMRLTTSFDARAIEVSRLLDAGRNEIRKAFTSLNLIPQGIDLGVGA